MWIALFLSAIGVAPPTVEIQTIGGQVFTGPLVELNDQGVAVQTVDGLETIDLGQLAGLVAKQPQDSDAPRPTVGVELADGSSIVAMNYHAQEGRARLTLAGGQVLELAARDILAVRMQPQNEALAGQWAKIRQTDLKTDLLVVRKDAVLDFHRGAVRAVDDATVQFQPEGDVLGVKRAKVFGIVYYHPHGRELPESKCRLTDRSGSTWIVRSLGLDGGALKWTTPLGLEVSRALASVARIDFSQGKILYLSDLDPDSLHLVPYLGAIQQLPTRMDLYAPRKDMNLNGGPLEVNGKIYPKGLALHSRTELVYRLPADFRRFKATAGIDDAVRPRGNVHLAVRGDGRVLFESAVTGTDPPKPLDIDIAGVRRLSILVDFGADLDVADHLDLCDARIVK
ncbi:MAG: NPCBM/NEW2 domain-containing protein [Pirellulales bacterium]|nr:NPCBM/NEW2 domain-containing protein [Pirellulales bacterium]